MQLNKINLLNRQIKWVRSDRLFMRLEVVIWITKVALQGIRRLPDEIVEISAKIDANRYPNYISFWMILVYNQSSSDLLLNYQYNFLI